MAVVDKEKAVVPWAPGRPSLTAVHVDHGVDTGVAQPGRAAFLAGGGVDQGDDGAGDAGVEQSLPARRRAAMVVARLQGDHRGAASGVPACRGQGVDFGVRFAFALVVALADHVPVAVEDHAADRWVRAGAAQAERRQQDRPLHGPGLDLGCHRHRLAFSAGGRRPSESGPLPGAFDVTS